MTGVYKIIMIIKGSIMCSLKINVCGEDMRLIHGSLRFSITKQTANSHSLQSCVGGSNAD